LGTAACSPRWCSPVVDFRGGPGDAFLGRIGQADRVFNLFPGNASPYRPVAAQPRASGGRGLQGHGLRQINPARLLLLPKSVAGACATASIRTGAVLSAASQTRSRDPAYLRKRIGRLRLRSGSGTPAGMAREAALATEGHKEKTALFRKALALLRRTLAQDLRCCRTRAPRPAEQGA